MLSTGSGGFSLYAAPLYARIHPRKAGTSFDSRKLKSLFFVFILYLY